MNEIMTRMPDTVKGVEARMVAVGMEIEALIESTNRVKADVFKLEQEIFKNAEGLRQAQPDSLKLNVARARVKVQGEDLEALMAERQELIVLYATYKQNDILNENDY